MSKLLDMLNDEEFDFTVSVTDTSGETGKYEFLDIVLYEKNEYAVLLSLENAQDGMVDIFRIIVDSGSDEKYERVDDEAVIDGVFELFKLKNEDEFDFT